MRRFFVFFLTAVLTVTLLVPAFSADVSLSGNDIKSESAILMNMESGQILFEKNAHQKMYPASITKILTCLLALENLPLDRKITAPADDPTNNPSGEILTKIIKSEKGDLQQLGWQNITRVPISVGDCYTVRDLLYAAALRSANDACDVLAYAVDGSIEAFTARMNRRAQEIGCTDTHFSNTNGLPAEDHYTSAADMAKIMTEAMKNDAFADFFGPQYEERKGETVRVNARTITEQNTGKTTTCNVGHGFLHTKSGVTYSYATAGKTGVTTRAGYTLVTTANIRSMQLVCVTMKAETRAVTYNDTKALFNSVEGLYKPMRITPEMFGVHRAEQTENGEKVADLELTLREPVTFWVPNEIFFENLSVTFSIPDTVEGTLPQTVTATFSYDGVENVGTATVSVLRKETTAPQETQNEQKGNVFVTILIILGILVLCFLVLALALWIYSEIRRKERIKRKRLQRLNREAELRENGDVNEQKGETNRVQR